MTRDQHGNSVSINPSREADGTWSATVWFGGALGPATNIERRYGYLTRAAARQADISETVAQTNRRVCKR